MSDLRRYTDRGVAVIAATERLARHMRVSDSLAMRNSGAQAWATPPIFGYRTWVRSQWLGTWPAEQILHAAQELSIWTYSVESGEEADNALSKTAVARQARLAGTQAQDFEIAVEPLDPFCSADEAAFARWRSVVEERMAKYGWVMESGLAARLVDQLQARCWAPPKAVVLVGFLEETPAQKRLFAALEAAGATVERTDILDPVESQFDLGRPLTRVAQYREVACRIREALEPYSGSDDKSPPRIGVLVPDLEQARAGLEPVLREYLAPFLQVPGPHRDRAPWRYARGLPLAEHPLVAAAMDLLTLEPYRNDLAQVSRVLLSAGLFMGFRRADRCAVDVELRDGGGTRFSLQRIRKASERMSGKLKEKAQDNAFVEFLAQLCGVLSENMPEALPSEWADWYQQLLQAAQWARLDHPTAEEQQVLDGWDNALDAFRAMDTQVRRISRSRALLWLREILADQPFQPAVSHLQPVHVLGYWDVAGLNFDHLYVLDFNAGVMPEAARSNAFLSTDRCAAAGVRVSTPEGCLERAQEWLAHVRRLAPAVTFLSPCFDDRGAGLQPSPLVAGWPEAVAPDATAAKSALTEILAAGVQTVWPAMAEDVAPPIGDPAAEGVRGGTSVFSDMTTSPLVAFARARVGMRPLEGRSDGLDAATQGELVHRVLERFWLQVKTQAALKAMTPEELSATINLHVVGAMEADGKLPAAHYGPGLVEVERMRVCEVLAEWLDLEKRRVDPFEVVAAEVRAVANIEGLPQNLRVDRIDKIMTPAGEKFVVIDYKTGAVFYREVWEPEKLSEPQLPIYAVYADLSAAKIDRVDGIAFARVRETESGFVVWSNFADSLLADKKGGTGAGDPGWGTTCSRWRDALAQLARRFMAGDVTVDPTGFRRSRFDADLSGLVRSGRPEEVMPAGGAGEVSF